MNPFKPGDRVMLDPSCTELWPVNVLTVGNVYTVLAPEPGDPDFVQLKDDTGATDGWFPARFKFAPPLVPLHGVTLDPADPFDAVLLEMITLNRKKRGDYVSDDSPSIFENFDRSDDQVGLESGDSIEVLIATKQSRIRAIRKNGRGPNNESEEDSLLDRAIYSVLALAKYRERTSDG